MMGLARLGCHRPRNRQDNIKSSSRDHCPGGAAANDRTETRTADVQIGHAIG